MQKQQLNKAEKGREYLNKGKYKEAAQKFKDWLRKYPSDKNAWLDLGACLYHSAYLEPALEATKKSMTIDPSFPLAHNNMGLYYQMKNDGETASQWYAKAADGGYTDANFNLALSYLRVLMDNLSFGSKWDLAWEMYDWRFLKSSPVPLPKCPEWMTRGFDGVRPVMVLTEQGVGDTIMFSRYLQFLPPGSCFAIPEALNPVFADLDMWKVNDTLECNLEQWIPAGDLPKYFKSIPAGPATVSGGSKVGVCWQGNKEHANDNNRSYPELKKEMLKLGVSLQFGHNPEIKDWADTLRIMGDCHTIITVDTSVAHLAGYLGKRCLVLMPKYDWDFRWGTGSKNHWYPSVTAYKDWDSLVADL